MMMIGDPPRSNPTVQIPPLNYHYTDDPTAHINSPVSQNFSDSSQYEKAFGALQRYLPSNMDGVVQEEDEDSDDFDVPVDAFSSDNFRMYDFKVKMCSRARSHDWTECPLAHPGEKARRRDPRKYHYSGSACPDFRRGLCQRADACEYAHGVFECWLHPDRYRTHPCKDGTHCRRRVCFFAHTPDQLRVLRITRSPDGSPSRLGYDTEGRLGCNPFTLLSYPPNSTMYSPPLSPTTASPPVSPARSMRLSQLAESMHGLQLNNAKMGLGMGSSVSPPSRRLGIGSPRSPFAVRPGFMSLPSTPLRAVTRSGLSAFDSWDSCEEPVMERVESGRELREIIYAKLGKENSLDRVDWVEAEPDVGWVSDLVN